MTMNHCFCLKYLYHDSDMIELQFAAFNGRFGGTANVYMEHTRLSEAAKNLEGFPLNASDRKEISFGAFGPRFAGGGVRLRFYCKDLAGHVVVEATIEDDYGNLETTESATVVLNIEPAGIDEFILGMRRLESELSGSATLVAGR
jgi:hypothetical protein